MARKLIAMLLLLAGAGTAAGQEVTYRAAIAPLWSAQCIACHGAKSPERADYLLDREAHAARSQGPRMDSYERLIAFVGWPDTGALMRRLDDGTSKYGGGKPGNMYVYLGSNENERAANLKLFRAWVGEGAWNLNRASKRGEVPAITQQQLNAIQLKY